MSSSGRSLDKYRIPLGEIMRATKNFSSETLIGDGGFGFVHIGQLSEEWNRRTVAIKCLNQDGYQGNNEFHNELDMVSSFHHPNIVTFIGYCDESDHMIIVYEYAINKSLDRHLQDPHKMRSLTWTHRLNICLGAAKGLKYLHSGLGEDKRVIHRDVKSANILLDENLEAKICDFGLSKFGTRNQEDSQVHTKVAGTRFYMDPVYNERSSLTKESDVYSFGVVMFEMSSGTLVYNPKCFGDDDNPQYLINVVRRVYDDVKKAADPDNLIDPIIRDGINLKSFHTFNKIAHECLSLDLHKRPPLARIIRKIELALKIQLNHHESPSSITTRILDSYIIPLEQINLATNNFSRETYIRGYGRGVGDSGPLYARWQNHTNVINRLNPKSYPGENEFNKALQIVSSFHHQNISRFVGYCVEGDERIIVHEYCVNGSLSSYLNDSKKRRLLTWAQRLKICLGVARALQYLHLALGEDNEEITGNIMCNNILLDESVEAKICFFGLSSQGYSTRMGPREHISNMFSFGMIMFEILSGGERYALAGDLEPGNEIDILLEYYDNNELDQFIDKYISDQIDGRCLKIFKETAYRCVMRGRWLLRSLQPGGRGMNRVAARRDRGARITMDEVVQKLEDAADFE
ncbi:putative receptor-like protein kinase At5g39000 [Lactuca sativa]|uniref:putative receptor-like protein kinase At5g39000 n=1 Tax=Lactuca sativa TaxID=4236 RepID=UPI000CB1F9AF|nr:putative receptor-like protein kinase At5g39000 [Lactuca sativa]